MVGVSALPFSTIGLVKVDPRRDEITPDRPKLVKTGDAVIRAVDEIRYRIMTGRLAAGEQLRQEELARELLISRAPIREALRALSDQGLLEHRVHSGYFVKKRPAEELRQIYQILGFLEGLVMEELPPATPEVIDRLRNINDKMREFIRTDDWSPMVFRLSPLKVVLEELERLWTIAAPYIAQRYTTEAMRARTIFEHEGLIDALTSRDSDALTERLAIHRSQRQTAN
jgi:DNA-binding GntR family transcriptional regulator